MKNILLTRPREDSQKLAAILQAKDYACIQEPIMDIQPSNIPAPQTGAIQFIMITSRHALRFLPDDFNDLHLPCYCVGAQTANTARARGFEKVLFSQGDGADLAKLIIEDALFTKGLHICGRDINSTADDILRDAGYAVTLWPIYTTQARAHLSPSTKTLIETGKIDIALFFSPQSTQNFITLITRENLIEISKKIHFLGLSAACLAPLKNLGFSHLTAAPEPNTESIVATLEKL